MTKMRTYRVCVSFEFDATSEEEATKAAQREVCRDESTIESVVALPNTEYDHRDPAEWCGCIEVTDAVATFDGDQQVAICNKCNKRMASF